VARSTPNGYTLMANDLTYSMYPHVFKSLPWDHERDLVPVTTLCLTPYALVVNGKAPFKTLQELIAHARANPGALTFGSGGPGSAPHFTLEAFMLAANVELRHIPYKGGGEALTGVIAGQVDVLMASTPSLVPQAKAGRIRMLGVSGKRVPALPEVPTFPEAGLKDFGIINFFGWWAPKGTPTNVLAKLQAEVVKALGTADIKTFLESQASDPGGASSEAFRKQVTDATKLWAAVAARAKIEKQ
jgi:tripartite-type tricarboxylate transporter receptor subunit TctC